jgi:signal transduction histidine kinase
LRFDDSLDTVLSADASSPLGARSIWLQLVDLIGRRRVPPAPDALARLRAIRDLVPAAVRSTSARALEYADPPVELVALFAEDAPDIAAPILRGARIAVDEWIALLPVLGPRTRSILRHRRDLDSAVVHALAQFAGDFALSHEGSAVDDSAADASTAAAAVPPPAVPSVAPLAPVHPPHSFVSFGEATRSVPAVAAALRHGIAEDPVAPPPPGPFQISELVARIAAYQRQRESAPPAAMAGSDADAPPASDFRFETDAAGVVRWVDGVSRGPLIGLSLDLASSPDGSRVDGVAAGAFRRRAPFTNARLVVVGQSDAGGDWRVSGVPAFDPASGRFIGYRGSARRPRADEQAGPAAKPGMPPDALRQLVHELRTPTNAIAGFAEMIESQLLGPVADPYRARAIAIRDQARELLGAIEDLDLAARIEGRALDLREGSVAIAPLLARIADDLAPLATLRGTTVAIDDSVGALDVAGDERAVERLLGRLVAALVAAGGRDERIGIAGLREDDVAILTFDRPAALPHSADDALFSIDEADPAEEGAPLLGTGFALRLVRNLATELGGSLSLGATRLTLRLPAAVTAGMGQASIN